MKKHLLVALCLLTLVGTSCTKQEQAKKVDGRYVPERKDDFAWENEYAAFRFYGPALLPENPSNGVDLWLKNSPALVIDTMYGRELKDGRPYHINYDGNLDCYKVAHTAGCGGVVIATDSNLWIAGPYSEYEILEQTPDKFVFRLTYDSVPVAGKIFAEQLTVTAEAGKILNKAEVVIMPKRHCCKHHQEMAEGEQKPCCGKQCGHCHKHSDMLRLWVGGGIFLHDTIENYRIDEVRGLVAYAEDALSDKQAAKMNYEYNGSTSQGRSYIAVMTPGATRIEILDGTFVSLKEYQLGDTLTYYFGGCWSKWSNGEQSFPTDLDWFEAL